MFYWWQACWRKSHIQYISLTWRNGKKTELQQRCILVGKLSFWLLQTWKNIWYAFFVLVGIFCSFFWQVLRKTPRHKARWDHEAAKKLFTIICMVCVPFLLQEIFEFVLGRSCKDAEDFTWQTKPRTFFLQENLVFVFYREGESNEEW